MNAYQLSAIVYIVFCLALAAVGIYLLVLVVKALKKYIHAKEVREEKRIVRKSLAEALRENRLRCKMTQEFVSEALGVSRQAVSKWETGSADPSTSNLIALANLYGISAEDLLRGIETGGRHEKDGDHQEGDGE